jgi:hypothetical protein
MVTEDDHYSRQLADLRRRKLELERRARNAKVEKKGLRKLNATARDRNWRANILFVLRSRYNEPDTKFDLHIGQLTNISVRSSQSLLRTYERIGIPESIQTRTPREADTWHDCYAYVKTQDAQIAHKYFEGETLTTYRL